MLSVQVLHFDNLKHLGLPIVVGITVVIIARMISIYIPLSAYNIFAAPKKKIPQDWMRILSWGSLRGAIAVACLLVIPDDLQIQGWNMEISEKEFVNAIEYLNKIGIIHIATSNQEINSCELSDKIDDNPSVLHNILSTPSVNR